MQGCSGPLILRSYRGLLLLLLVPLLSLASSEDTSAHERLASLHNSAERRGLDFMRFNDARIDEFVNLPVDRNYSLVLFFSTNNPKCAPCRQVSSMLSLVKRGFGQAEDDNRSPQDVFFAELWAQKSPQAFEKFGIDNVPAVVFVESAYEWEMVPRFHKASFGDLSSLAKLVSWLNRLSGAKVKVVNTLWWADNAVPMVIVAICAVFFIYNGKDVLLIAQMPMFWLVIAICVYGFTMSGMHWNMLRGAPLLARSASGIQVIRGGYSQTIVEGLIMAALFIGAGFTWIQITRLPRERDPGKRVLKFSFLAVTWTLIFCWVVVIYAGAKNRGYRPLSYAMQR